MSAPYWRMTSSGAVVLPERLRHLHAVLVEGEAVGHHRVVGRAPPRAAGLEHRGVEPAAVLVGALEVDARRPDAVGAVAQHEGVGRARVEPDVEDVGDDLPVLVRVVVAEEAGLGVGLEPGVGALVLEGVADPGVDGGVAEDLDGAVRPALDEAGQRHAPGALARQHPVGAGLDHRVEAVAAGHRRPLDEAVDRGQRALADGGAVGVHAVAERLVDGDEPLRGVAVDHRGLRAPRVRVAVGRPPAGEEAAGLDQLVDDGAVGRPSLPLASKTCRPLKNGTCSAKDESSRTLWVIRSTRPFLTKSS